MWFIGKERQKKEGRIHTHARAHTHTWGGGCSGGEVWLETVNTRVWNQERLGLAAWRHLLCGLQETEAILIFEMGEKFVQYRLRNTGVLLKGK